jgi:K+-sensing histidine kinase KdpD
MPDTHILSNCFPALLASSVHDIKNSLGNLRGLICHIEKICQEPIATELKKLNFEANRMNNCLVQLLTLYKIDSSKYSLVIDEHSTFNMINDVVDQHFALFSLGNNQLLTQYQDDLLCYCDRALVCNALCTMVNNAQRYCLSKVLLSATTEEDYVVFSIEDDGIGFPKNLLSCDYEQFSQDDLTTGNTGLGLFFANIIAKLHTQGEKRGFIKTDNNSRLGGARFSLYLP